MSKRPTRRAKSAPRSATPVATWLVFRIGGPRAGKVGIVSAPDEKAAITKAIEEFEIQPADHRRLFAQCFT